mmetsp:Transcript_33019/g.71314  ORF Transcript_33019/g.71314 Transcript_33019/m.71314 type:complete len:206 (+) Transcript_33019:1-618(+)
MVVTTVDTEPIYCAEQIAIPEALGEILKAYSKEVIRQNPQDIYQFSARYFEQLCQGWEGETPIELAELQALVAAFQENDKPGVTVEEFKACSEASQVNPDAVQRVLGFLGEVEAESLINWKFFIVCLCSLTSDDRDGLVEALFQVFGYADEGEEPRMQGGLFLDLYEQVQQFDDTITQEEVERAKQVAKSEEVTLGQYMEHLGPQ